MIKVASYNMRKGIGLDRRRDPGRVLSVLRELDADIIRLGGEHGSQIYAQLRARSASMRAAMLNDELAQANAIGEKMSIPMSVLGAIFLLILIALVVASPVAAQTASSRGTGSASYGLRLSADTRAQALNKAKVNALEAYIAETGAAKLRLFEARRAEFIGEIDRYVLSAVPLSDTEDKKAKTYTVTVRAEINTTLLQTKLDAGSAVAGATAAQRSLLTFLFMARSQDTVQSFQDKEYRRVDASSSYSENTREGDSFRGNSVSTNGSINQNGSVSVTSGGSTTQRSTCQRLMPRAEPASHCPCAMARMPAATPCAR